MQSDTTLDVQVVAAGSSVTQPSSASPMVTGFVYETTPGGRVPLPGLIVWLEAGLNIHLVAVTRTDDAGRFFLCRECPGLDGRLVTAGMVSSDPRHWRSVLRGRT